MIKGYKALFILAATTLLFMAIDWALQKPQQWWWHIMPNTVFRLSLNMWLGICLTFLASLVAWAGAMILGYALGVIAGAAIVDKQHAPFFNAFGKSVNQVFDAVYIIPFVLTITLVYASAMTYHVAAGSHLSGPGVVALVLIASGLVLGGYHVYKGVYEAVANAKYESRVLVDSVYSRFDGRGTHIGNALLCWEKAHRLRDCEIEAFSRGILRAFSLAVVAVMIAEAVTPSFYDLLLPQARVAKPWLGGIGRQIITSQSTYDFETIAGAMWVVFLFSATFGVIMWKVMSKRWLQYYGGTEL